MKYKIKEIFSTIEGEAGGFGEVVTFLRFSNCNKWNGNPLTKPNSICSFCDTDFVGGKEMDEKEIMNLISTNNPKIKTIVLSGGEPTLQLKPSLLEKLKRNGYKLYLETNGSRALGDCLQYIDKIVCSPKQTRAGTKIERIDELKILYPFLYNIEPESFNDYNSKVYLQPIWDDKYKDNLKNLIDYLMVNPKYILSIQNHKILGLE